MKLTSEKISESMTTFLKDERTLKENYAAPLTEEEK